VRLCVGEATRSPVANFISLSFINLVNIPRYDYVSVEITV
jgi:hypothetical protein